MITPHLTHRPVAGMELSGLVWTAGRPQRLDLDPVCMAPGEIGVVVAPPAVGTALADVLVGLARPLHGTVLVAGRPATGPPGQRGITLIPGDGGLLPHLTVERNVGFGLVGVLPRSTRRTRVAAVLKTLHLTSVGHLHPHEISPEQRLRVAVARAMCASAETSAVVVEDRDGPVPGRVAALTAAEQELAVLLITRSQAGAAGLACSVLTSSRPWPPGQRPDLGNAPGDLHP